MTMRIYSFSHTDPDAYRGACVVLPNQKCMGLELELVRIRIWKKAFFDLRVAYVDAGGASSYEAVE